MEHFDTLLRHYACSKFTVEEQKFIDENRWEDNNSYFDPRVFQAFVWAEAWIDVIWCICKCDVRFSPLVVLAVKNPCFKIEMHFSRISFSRNAAWYFYLFKNRLKLSVIKRNQGPMLSDRPAKNLNCFLPSLDEVWKVLTMSYNHVLPI